MSDQSQTPPLSNGAEQPPAAEPRQSLREIAEAAWDELEPAADDGSEPPSGQDGRQRDSLGRFAPADPAAKPGEQSNDPAPQIVPDASDPAKPVDPAPTPGSSNQPPQHWAEADRKTFATLPPAGQEFLLRRHTEMERDYSAKTQAAATAVQFTQSLAPVFTHPVIAGALQAEGISPAEAINQWAGFQARAVDPNPQVRIGLLQELAKRMGLVNPAANGQQSPPILQGLSEEDQKDPVIRQFADHIGKTLQDVQALRGELTQYQQRDAERQNAETLKTTRWAIDSFADEKDAQGRPLRPHFDAVLPALMEMFRINPQRDMQEAYDTAIWSVPSIRAQLIAAERNSVQKQQGNERARQAVRGNVRGITSPVAKPASDGKKGGLRATLEASADEVGY